MINLVLIESEKLHDFLADYYDEVYKKYPIFAKASLSTPIRNFKEFIEKLEKGSEE